MSGLVCVPGNDLATIISRADVNGGILSVQVPGKLRVVAARNADLRVFPVPRFFRGAQSGLVCVPKHCLMTTLEV